MKDEKDLILYLKDNYGKKSYKQMSEETGNKISKLHKLVYNHIPNRFSRGKNPFCHRSQRKLNVDDNCFNKLTKESCYWAGLIAADGNISKHDDRVNLLLKEGDKEHLINFKSFLRYDGTVKVGFSKYYYNGVEELKPYAVINFKSNTICENLKENFNIVKNKSLTLLPPNIDDNFLMDCFIIGYIDGDGSVFLGKSKKQKSLQITVVGTRKMLEWIQGRFSKILNEKLSCIYKKNIHDKKNTYLLMVGDRRAREIFKHYYSIDVIKLERKWTKEFYEHCVGWKKYRNFRKYKEIIKLDLQGLTQKQISEKMLLTQVAVSWYKKQDLYKSLKEELENEN